MPISPSINLYFCNRDLSSCVNKLCEFLKSFFLSLSKIGCHLENNDFISQSFNFINQPEYNYYNSRGETISHEEEMRAEINSMDDIRKEWNIYSSIARIIKPEEISNDLSIIEMFKGNIKVESNLSGGSTFIIQLLAAIQIK